MEIRQKQVVYQAKKILDLYHRPARFYMLHSVATKVLNVRFVVEKFKYLNTCFWGVTKKTPDIHANWNSIHCNEFSALIRLKFNVFCWGDWLQINRFATSKSISFHLFPFLVTFIFEGWQCWWFDKTEKQWQFNHIAALQPDYDGHNSIAISCVKQIAFKHMLALFFIAGGFGFCFVISLIKLL